MDLRDAARRFNDAEAFDGYTGEYVFNCHFSSFDDHSAAGATARRRALGLTDEDTVPARQVVSIYNDRWLVGSGNPDSFGGKVLRRVYNMKRSTDLAAVLTPAQACMSATGTLAYVHKQWFREVVNVPTDSKIDNFWTVFIAPGEPVEPGTFFRCGSVLLRARNTYLPVEGLRVAQCDDIDFATQKTLLFRENGNFDAATDSYPALNYSVFGLVVDYTKLFRLRTSADLRAEPGDVSVLVPQASITPVVGAKFMLGAIAWRVLSVEAELDAWLMHCRRA
jgi:hypothetical protein